MDYSKFIGIFFVELLFVLTSSFLYTELGTIATDTGLTIASITYMLFPYIWSFLIIAVLVLGLKEAVKG